MTRSKDSLDIAIKALWCAMGALVDIGYNDADILHVFNDKHIPDVLSHIRSQKKELICQTK